MRRVIGLFKHRGPGLAFPRASVSSSRPFFSTEAHKLGVSGIEVGMQTQLPKLHKGSNALSELKSKMSVVITTISWKSSEKQDEVHKAYGAFLDKSEVNEADITKMMEVIESVAKPKLLKELKDQHEVVQGLLKQMKEAAEAGHGEEPVLGK